MNPESFIVQAHEFVHISPNIVFILNSTICETRPDLDLCLAPTTIKTQSTWYPFRGYHDRHSQAVCSPGVNVIKLFFFVADDEAK
jgi:hypothetical protein